MAVKEVADLSRALEDMFGYSEKIWKQWESKNNAFANMSNAAKGTQIGINGIKTAMNALTMATHVQTAAEKVKQLIQKSDPISLLITGVAAGAYI